MTLIKLGFILILVRGSIIFGGLVFYQVKIAKDDLQTRCEREAAAAAVDLAEKVGKELIPLLNAYYKKANSQGYIFKHLALKNFCFEEIEGLTPAEKQSYAESINFFRTHTDFYDDCTIILNWLEVFSMNFTKGVANEDVLFTAAAQVYCNFVERSFAMLCFTRHTDEFKLYENTIELYNLWSDKIKIKGLALQQEGIKERMQKINNGKKIIPIGFKK